MIILDTNVLSALMKRAAEPSVVAWLDRQPRSSIWTTSITVFEIRFGLQILPAGKKRTLLTQGFDGILSDIDHRILDFDSEAAAHAADLMACRHHTGRPVELRDTMIAGIVLARHASLATRNTTHFEDLKSALIDPWTAR